MTPIITPSDTTDHLIWSSSDPLSVRVDSAGEIFAIKDSGKPVTVTVVATSGEMAQCEVVVRTKNPYEATLDDMQSQHPYMKDCETYYEYARENAIGYRVTFSEDTSFESDFDFLYILDEKEDEINKYTGKELAGKTVTIHGSRIKLKLCSDENVTEYGFQITKIEPLNEVIPTPTPTATSTVVPTPTASPENKITPHGSSLAFKAQTIKTTKIKTIKAKTLKKKSVKVNLKAKADGNSKLTYKITKYPKGMKKYIKVNQKGVVTFKKKAKKGTYQIRITAAASGKYKRTTKVISIKVK